MVDYKLLADNDPGGDLQQAFDLMSIQTVDSTPEVLMTYRTIASKVGFAESGELEAAVLGEPTLPQWLNVDLQSRGIDVNDPQVAGLLNTLVSAATAANITAAGVIVSPKYPNMKVGHLKNARDQRNDGVI